jgi:uncharacterized protein YodC (DUF2158 family)
MNAESGFKVGDTVQLKSGGPVMTITSIGETSEYDPTVYAWCSWFKNNNETTTKHFPLAAIIVRDPK